MLSGGHKADGSHSSAVERGHGPPGPGSLGDAPVRSGRHHYCLDGVICIDSAVVLPELVVFRVDSIGEPDLVIEVAAPGGIGMRASARASAEGGGLLYSEHLGGLFANFRLDPGPPLTLTASRVLARSPHVLYTNVVEGLLRSLFARSGRVLLHAACVRLGGTGVLVSARTDTGKTTTILRLLQHAGASFLSDDMTVVDARGFASRYPKPLTISNHTLKAVPKHSLRLRERAALQLQSRVHSRSGRAAARWLASCNLPILAINALTQLAVPPPKYLIEALLSCPVDQEVKIQRLYLIERGTPKPVSHPGRDEALDALMANSADAYGFPPYSQLAPHLGLWADGYPELIRAERHILDSALRAVSVSRLQTDDFSWSDLIAGEDADVAGMAHPGMPVGRRGLEAATIPAAAGAWS
jgi:dolichol-phosphate mannosyltransferase